MINLLPPAEKKTLFQSRQKKLILILGIEFFVFLISVLLVFLAIQFYILGELSSKDFLFKYSESQEKLDGSLDLQNIIRKHNRNLSLIESFHKNQKFLSNSLINLLEVETPKGLYFTNLSVQSQENKILMTIAGFSDTRENLIFFKDNIESNNKINNVAFSTGSWISPKSINFNVSLEITDER
jgi:hypothetical protein